MEIPRSIGKYSIFGTLGQGGYGKVFVARDCKSLDNVAIKFSGCVELLKKEYKILQAVNGLEGFVKVFEFNTINQLGYIVMEMLGKNLQYTRGDLLLPIKTVSAVGLELLTRLETLHNKGLVHRDLKPQQFLLSNHNKTISLIDFGLATYYMVQNKHKSFKTQCTFKGSPSFASINCHMGFRQSRRDDLESLFYSLLYLVKGELPWNNKSRLTGVRKWNNVLNLKVRTDKTLLFKDLPAEFEIFFAYIRKIKYEEVPNYSYLRSLMRKFVVAGPLYLNFEWISNPFFNVKNESFVEMKKNKCFVVLHQGDWKIKVKRRNGYLDLSGNGKVGRSASFLQFSATQENLNSPCKVSKRRKRRALNISDSFSNGFKTTQKFSQRTYQGSLLNIPDFSSKSSVLNYSRYSESVQEFFYEKETIEKNLFIQNQSEECMTDRTQLPEMKDKSKILEKKLNHQESLKSSEAKVCIMF